MQIKGHLSINEYDAKDGIMRNFTYRNPIIEVESTEKSFGLFTFRFKYCFINLMKREPEGWSSGRCRVELRGPYSIRGDEQLLRAILHLFVKEIPTMLLSLNNYQREFAELYYKTNEVIHFFATDVKSGFETEHRF